ncbi:MAG: sulfatase-like hydrolase/transferase [Planctomycetes bacterium]|nr:sulfatase-like hydrolase/transferase [Planctomycetota bacterium]
MQKKNIILITVDSLRRDHLSCYDSHHVNTPNIDELAKDGIIFKNAFANGSNTVASVSSFLTSVPTCLIKREHITVQEVLKSSGYLTFALNPNVQLIYGFCRDLHLTRGFDRYDTLLGITRQKLEVPIEGAISIVGALTTRFFGRGNILYKLISNAVGYMPLPIAKPAPRASEINEQAISILKNNSDPVFLWLFYLDTHEPYLPSSRTGSFLEKLKLMNINRKLRYFRGNLTASEVERLHDAYVEEIEQFDREIGNLISELKRNDLYDDALIIFTADHGEQFGEHGDFGHAALYDEVISVPLIVKEPKKGGAHQSGIIDVMVSLADLAPTITDAAELKKVDSFWGDSLRMLYGSSNAEPKPVLCFGPDTAGEGFCYRTETKKIICRKDRIELYDLKENPLEKENLCRENSEVLKGLQQEALDYMSQLRSTYARLSERTRIKRAMRRVRKT